MNSVEANLICFLFSQRDNIGPDPIFSLKEVIQLLTKATPVLLLIVHIFRSFADNSTKVPKNKYGNELLSPVDYCAYLTDRLVISIALVSKYGNITYIFFVGDCLLVIGELTCNLLQKYSCF